MVGRLTALTAAVALFCAVSMAAGAQADDRKSSPYPTVGETPLRPEKPSLTADDISRLKKDLTATRDRQAPKGKPAEGTAPVTRR